WELRRMSYTVATNEHTPTIRRLLLQDDITAARSVIEQLPEHPETAGLTDAFRALEEKSTQHRLLLPAFRWNGFDNQYQRWIGQLLRGDLGSSLIDKRPVGPKVWAAAKVTALINGLAIFLVFLLSIPIGLMAAGYQGGWFDRLSTFGLFLLFGIPSFWLAMLMANYLTTPAFGMDFFPSMGLGNIPDGTSWWTAFRIRSSHLFLPVVCIAYPSLAYVSRHLRQSALKQLDQAYIKTARLKGLSQRSILWGHVFQNASFPIITLLGGIFPALLAGSVLIERIFNLPGMGQLLYNAALERDWPVVITLVLLNGVLTAIGLMMADLGYALADPRVRFSSTKNSVP
ncbi:MAG: ABC transporter permease, partial [Bacteroidota bacterium]